MAKGGGGGGRGGGSINARGYTRAYKDYRRAINYGNSPFITPAERSRMGRLAVLALNRMRKYNFGKD